MMNIDLSSAFSFAVMPIRRLLRAHVVVIAVGGIVLPIAGFSLTLPPSTVTPDAYASVVSSGSNKATGQSYLVFVRRATASIPMPYQLYDGEEMISAGQGNNLCHIY